MNSKERENFLRNAILVCDNAREALVSLVDLDLANKGLTFEQFVITNQHEIYHLYNSSRCCQCPPVHHPIRSPRILHRSQMNLLFDRSLKLSCHNTFRWSADFCCSMARSGLCTDVLDLTLARCLLVNVCSDVFWISCLRFQSITFEDFLNHNKHELYHLWQYNALCCQCSQGYTFPTKYPVLNQNDWIQMFNAVLLPCDIHRKRPSPGSMQSICSVAAASGITLMHLSQSVSRIILQHCCPLWTAVETLLLIKNQNSHSKEGKMSDNDYNTSVVKIERCIIDIAKVCNKETHFKQKLHATIHEDIVLRHNIQQHNLIETLTRQQDSNLMELNFSRMGIIVMNILTDILYDRLNLDGQNVPLRSKCDFTYLYNEHRKLYLHKASNSNICSDGPWGGTWQDIENLDLAIGDDIERIRLIRNELFNTSTYELEETRYNELSNIIRDISGRFDQHNKPSLLYSDRMKEMVAKVISDEEAKNVRKYIENEIADKDDVVPTEIKLMSDKRSVPIYLKLLKFGSEKKRDIRLVIVGKKGAGKTSLLKRLFGEELGAVDSTNGIEIHRIKCKTRSTDVNWKKINGNNEEFERNSRLLRPYRERLMFQNEVADSHATPFNQHEEKVTTHDIGIVETSEQEADRNSINNNNNTTLISSEEILYSRTASDQQAKVALHISHQAGKVQLVSHVTVNETEKQQSNLSVDQVNEEIKEMLNSEVDFNDKDEYATLLLWDFAGDEEFYHTHQTFLSPDSIYLVVTNLSEADNKDAQGIFRLWIDSIHCYCRPNELSHISNIDTKSISDDPLDPPVILVGTWKDQVQNPAGEEIMDVCHASLYKFAEAVSEDACRHIRDEYTHFVSNRDDDDTAFQPIREHILQLARTMKTWNTNYPLKFIQLEKHLQEKKKEIPIVSLHDLKLITSETPNPLNDEELMLFLKFHHEIRALIFFEDLSDYIILDTQWLSDAFKVVVTAEKFQKKSIKNRRKWDEFYFSGKLHSFVLKDMFKNEKNMLSEYKDYILNVMEKFDIIIRPNILDKDTGNEESCYYVPCIIKQKPECDIYAMLNATADTCQRSTWLCFQFTFLPPHLMNHLIASLCRRYKITEVVGSRQTKKRIALFKGTVVFEVDKLTELQKLLVITRSDLIQMQILEFGTDVGFEKGVYKLISKYVTKEINKIVSTRFKMTNLKFSKKWECGLVQPDSVTGCRDFGEQNITEYYCGMCRKIHKSAEEWSDLPTKSLGCIHHVQESDPQVETLTENKTVISTKVYFKGITSFSTNVSGVAGIGDTNNKLSKEEKNFTRMGMIALNILADVLYDLLELDGQNVYSRSEYDITQLYNEHRNLNKHIPSNSSKRDHGPWGGAWRNIQNTDTAIGDDIERIRLTRNELQHSSTYALEDTRFNKLCDITHDMLGRFEQHNRPTKLYSCRFKEVLATIISDEEAKSVRQQLEYKMDTETAFQIEVLHELHEPPSKKTKHQN